MSVAFLFKTIFRCHRKLTTDELDRNLNNNNSNRIQVGGYILCSVILASFGFEKN